MALRAQIAEDTLTAVWVADVPAKYAAISVTTFSRSGISFFNESCQTPSRQP